VPSAFFTPGEVVLDAQGTGTVDVAPTTRGPVSITASAPGYTPGSARLKFLPPLRTLVAGGIGGLGGGLIRLLQRVRKGLSLTAYSSRVVVAVLVGLLVFGLYAIGVNLLPIKPNHDRRRDLRPGVRGGRRLRRHWRVCRGSRSGFDRGHPGAS